jgi:hypothetical protein
MPQKWRAITPRRHQAHKKIAIPEIVARRGSRICSNPRHSLLPREKPSVAQISEAYLNKSMVEV